jgi:hypothetical protein
MSRTFGPIGELTVQGVPIQLAPDLLALERRSGGGVNMYEADVVTMVAGVENAILTLTGKYAVSYLELRSLAAESMTVRLVKDSVEVWDSTITTGPNWALYNTLGSQSSLPAFQVGSELVLYLTTTTDTSIAIYHSEVKTL